MPRKPTVPEDIALPKLPEPPEFEVAKYKLPKPLLKNLEAYCACYKALRGKDIEADTLVGLIVEGHLAKDRAFAAWLQKQGQVLAR